MGKPEQFTAQQFIDVIPGTAGIITAIAKRVGCSWTTARLYIERYPTIKRAYQDECESVLDLAESKLIAAIKDGDLSAVKYMLSTKGKGRGFVERAEIVERNQHDIDAEIERELAKLAGRGKGKDALASPAVEPSADDTAI
jgi:hypothetical protein